MTDRDELRELISEILAEQDRQHGFTPRAPFVRGVDPDGKPWYSATVSRVQAISAVLALLATIFAGIWASMSARDATVVLPQVGRMIDAASARHEKEAAERFATKLEVAAVDATAKAVTAGRDEQIVALKQAIADLKAQNERIDAKLDRLLARGR